MAGKKVVAVLISEDDSLRMSVEEAMSRELTARGPVGVAGYRTIPAELLKDPAKARAWFERSIQSGGWPAFGFIASEAELRRLK